jgi:GTP-binding protein HflX
LLVFNKADIAGERAREMAAAYPGSVVAAARTGENLDEVLGAIGARLRHRDRVMTVRVPLARGDVLAAAHREGDVLETRVDDDALVVTVAVDPAGEARLERWRVR